MEIMDPYAHELLAHPPPPGFDHFSVDGAGNAPITTEQMDDYLRAIGVLPPLPPAAAPPTPGYTTPAATLWGAMDYGMELPATCELYAAAVDVHVRAQPVGAVLKNPATPYDAEIDASLRAMEEDPTERPSPEYLDTTQRGRMEPVARVNLVLWMCEFCYHYGLSSAVLHRAVSYADRFLSARALADDVASYDHQLRVLGAAAAYAAAKYEDRDAARRLNARDIASECGFSSGQEVLGKECAMVAALGYRLGGPTAHTFVDHFTRHSRRHGGDDEDPEQLRNAAHQLAEASLFDHCFLKLLPSAVAATAILLARMVLKPSYDDEQARRWSREIKELTGYEPVELKDGVDAMYSLMPDCYRCFEISPLFFVADS
ncbi:hypothetical protein ACP70R_027354 [Stipagrostis hirtigluma subsp. patula]